MPLCGKEKISLFEIQDEYLLIGTACGEVFVKMKNTLNPVIDVYKMDLRFKSDRVFNATFLSNVQPLG